MRIASPRTEPAPVKLPLRLGIMCEGTVFTTWQADCVQSLLALGYVKPALLIIDAEPEFSSPEKSLPRRIAAHIRSPLFGWSLFRLISRANRLRSDIPADLSKQLAGVPQIVCNPRKKGKFARIFSEAEVRSVRKHDLDFILRFAFNIVKGDILTSARWGVWSYHHDDLDVYRGAPACFWPLALNDPVQGATLQILTDGIDNGVVLHQGYFRTVGNSYRLNRDRVFMASADFPARVCRRIKSGDLSSVEAPPSRTVAPLRTFPKTRETFSALGVMAFNEIRSKARSAVARKDWRIGIIDVSLARLVESEEFADGFLPRPKWLPLHRNGWSFRDGFALPEKNGFSILARRFANGRNGDSPTIAKISWQSLSKNPGIATAISRNGGAGRPFAFLGKGTLYCCCQPLSSPGVLLYGYDDSTDNWLYSRRLFPDLPLLGPSVFRYENRYWLFGGIEGFWKDVSLHAFHSDEVDGAWHPHPLNPLLTDIRSAIPAGGFLMVEDRLYRLGLDRSKERESAVRVKRIETLSPENYRESAHRVLGFRPDRNPGWGLDSLSDGGEKTVCTGVRQVFSVGP